MKDIENARLVDLAQKDSLIANMKYEALEQTNQANEIS